jgi:hypothetical protein
MLVIVVIVISDIAGTALLALPILIDTIAVTGALWGVGGLRGFSREDRKHLLQFLTFDPCSLAAWAEVDEDTAFLHLY